MENLSRVEYFDDRWYKITTEKEGIETVEYLPSSTTLLGILNEPFLARWRGDIGNEAADFRSKMAMLKGTRVHNGIESLLLLNTLKIEDFEQDEWVQIIRFKSWFDSLMPTDIKAEHTTYSLDYGYAGTLDISCVFQEGSYNTGMSKPVQLQGGRYVGDWKTGKGISNKYFYQLSSYVEAEEERTGEKITGAFILHLQADTKSGWKMIIRTREELESDFETFLHIMAIWKKENKNLTPEVFLMPTEINLGLQVEPELF